MRIIIERKEQAEVIIDTENCVYPWAFRNAIEEALRIEGFEQSMINEIFGIMTDAVSPEEQL
jgi:hypothetical protein